MRAGSDRQANGTWERFPMASRHCEAFRLDAEDSSLWTMIASYGGPWRELAA
jgi:hypothetical protein